MHLSVDDIPPSFSPQYPQHIFPKLSPLIPYIANLFEILCFSSAYTNWSCRIVAFLKYGVMMMLHHRHRVDGITLEMNMAVIQKNKLLTMAV